MKWGSNTAPGPWRVPGGARPPRVCGAVARGPSWNPMAVAPRPPRRPRRPARGSQLRAAPPAARPPARTPRAPSAGTEGAFPTLPWSWVRPETVLLGSVPGILPGMRLRGRNVGFAPWLVPISKRRVRFRPEAEPRSGARREAEGATRDARLLAPLEGRESASVFAQLFQIHISHPWQLFLILAFHVPENKIKIPFGPQAPPLIWPRISSLAFLQLLGFLLPFGSVLPVGSVGSFPRHTSAWSGLCLGLWPLSREQEHALAPACFVILRSVYRP